MTDKIAFIGLGAMGGPMATNVIQAGIRLTVFDIVEERLERVVEAGGMRAESVADAAKDAAIVVTMLPATRHVLDAVTGADGVLAHMQKGGILMDMSTIAPTGTDQVIEAAGDHGVRFIDAPVGRLVSHAIAGQSLFMVGYDDDEIFASVKPLLDAMGTTIIHCGGPGSGIRAKVVNNFQILTMAQITAEALVLGQRLGLDIEVIKQVNAGTTANNGQFQINFATKSLIGDIEPGFTIDLAHKDMGLALEAADDVRLGLPVGAAAHAVYGSARGSDYAAKDFSALLNYACDLAGVEPPRLPAKRDPDET